MKVSVYNQKGEDTGTMELPDSVFGLKWNPDLVHQVAVSQAANRRVPAAHAKSRGEVRGGGRKPWRQKGTGRARHGSIRSPLWKGGGVTHGPLKEKVYKKKINKKMAKMALYTVLSAKARDKEIIVLEELKFVEPKTRFAAEVFDNLSAVPEFKNLKKGKGILVALPEKNYTARRAIRNLPYAEEEEARNLSAYQVLQFKYLMLPKDGLAIFK